MKLSKIPTFKHRQKTINISTQLLEAKRLVKIIFHF